MTQRAKEREPTPGFHRHEVPPPRPSMRIHQVVLLIVVVACLLTGVSMWLAHMLLYTVLAGIVAVVAIAMFVRGARNMRSKGSGMKLPGLVFRRTATEPPAQQAQEPGPHAIGPGSPQQAYPPGSQGHPFRPPKAQPARGRGPDHRAGIAAPPPAQHATSLPEPPVFVGRSTPGQAPWYLPVGAAPSGLAADGIRLGDLEVRAASIVGAGHRCEEPAIPRQDAYALGRTQDGRYLVVAVADGVSASEYADLAARIAVSAATRELARMLESGGLAAIDAGLLYKKIAGEIIGTGRSRGIPDEEVCAILITAVIPATARPDGTRPMWASWIGDVSLWVSRGGELLRWTGQDKTGLDRNELRAVLPFSPDEVEQLTLDLHPDDRVALMTDGVSDSLSSVEGTIDYFARQWAGPPPHPAAFLHSLCYDGPGQTDDRTAVVVWCNTPYPGGRRPAGDRR